MPDEKADIPSSAASRPPRRKRRWLRIAAGVLLALALFVAVLPWLLPEAWLGRVVAGQVTTATGYECRIAAVRFRWPLRITLMGVAVTGLPRPDAQLYVGRLAARTSLLALLRQRPERTTLEIDGAELYLFNVLGETSEGPTALKVDVPALRLEAPVFPGALTARGQIHARPAVPKYIPETSSEPSGTPPPTPGTDATRPAVDWRQWRAELDLAPLTVDLTMPEGRWDQIGAEAALSGVGAALSVVGLPEPVKLRLDGAAAYEPLRDQASARLEGVTLYAPVTPEYTRRALRGRLDAAFRYLGLSRPPAERTLEWDEGRLALGNVANDADPTDAPWAEIHWDGWQRPAHARAAATIASGVPGAEAADSVEGSGTAEDAAFGASVRGRIHWNGARPCLTPFSEMPLLAGLDLPDPFGVATLEGSLRWDGRGPSGAFRAQWRADETFRENGGAVVDGDPGAGGGAAPLAALSGAGGFDPATGAGRVEFLNFRSAPVSFRLAGVDLRLDPLSAGIERFDVLTRKELLDLARRFRERLPGDAAAWLDSPQSIDATLRTPAGNEPPGFAPLPLPDWMEADGPATLAALTFRRMDWDGAAGVAGLERAVFRSAPVWTELESARATYPVDPQPGQPRSTKAEVGALRLAARSVAPFWLRGMPQPPPPSVIDALTAPVLFEDPKTENPVLAHLEIDGLAWHDDIDAQGRADGGARLDRLRFRSTPAVARLRDARVSLSGAGESGIGRLDAAVTGAVLPLAEKLSGLLPPEARTALDGVAEVVRRAREQRNGGLELTGDELAGFFDEPLPTGSAPWVAVSAALAQRGDGGFPGHIEAPFLQLQTGLFSARLSEGELAEESPARAAGRARFAVRPLALAGLAFLEDPAPAPSDASAPSGKTVSLYSLATKPETLAALTLPAGTPSTDPATAWLDGGDALARFDARVSTVFPALSRAGEGVKGGTPSLRVTDLEFLAAPLSAWLTAALEGDAGKERVQARYELALHPEAFGLLERFGSALPLEIATPLLGLSGSRVSLYACGQAGFDAGTGRATLRPDATLAAEWQPGAADRSGWRLRLHPGVAAEATKDGGWRVTAPGVVAPTPTDYPHLPLDAWRHFPRNVARTDRFHLADADADNQFLLALAPDAEVLLTPAADGAWRARAVAASVQRPEVRLSARLQLIPLARWAFPFLPPSRLASDFLPFYDAALKIDVQADLEGETLRVTPHDLTLTLAELAPDRLSSAHPAVPPQHDEASVVIEADAPGTIAPPETAEAISPPSPDAVATVALEEAPAFSESVSSSDVPAVGAVVSGTVAIPETAEAVSPPIPAVVAAVALEEAPAFSESVPSSDVPAVGVVVSGTVAIPELTEAISPSSPGVVASAINTAEFLPPLDGSTAFADAANTGGAVSPAVTETPVGVPATREPPPLDPALGPTGPVATIRFSGQPVAVTDLRPGAWKVEVDARLQPLCFLVQRLVRAAPAVWLGLENDVDRAPLVAAVESVLARGDLALALSGDEPEAEGAWPVRVSGRWRDARVLAPNIHRTAYTQTLMDAPRAGWAATGSWSPRDGLTLSDAGLWLDDDAGTAPVLLAQAAAPDGPPLRFTPAGALTLRPALFLSAPGGLARMFPRYVPADALAGLSGSARLAAEIAMTPEALTVANGSFRLSSDFVLDRVPHGRLAPWDASGATDVMTFSARVEQPSTAGALPVVSAEFALRGLQWLADRFAYRLDDLSGRVVLRDGVFRLSPLTGEVTPTGPRAGSAAGRLALDLEVDLSHPDVAPPPLSARLRIRGVQLPDALGPFLPENVELARGLLNLPTGADEWLSVRVAPGATPDTPPTLTLDRTRFEIRDLGVIYTLTPSELAMLRNANLFGQLGGAMRLATSLAGAGAAVSDTPDGLSAAEEEPENATFERILRFDPEGRRALGFTRIHGALEAAPGGGFRFAPDEPLTLEGNQSPHFVVTGGTDWVPGLPDGALDMEVRIAKNLRRLLDYEAFLQTVLGSILGAGVKLPPERRAELAHELALSMERKVDSGALRFPVTGTLSSPNVTDGLLGMIRAMMEETIRRYAVTLPRELLFQQLENTMIRELSGQ